MNRSLIIIASCLVLTIGFLPFGYYLLNVPFGLFNMKNREITTNVFWQLFFHLHIVFAATALLTGWLQFRLKLSKGPHYHWHGFIGEIYAISFIISSLSALYISPYSNGGTPAFLGFFTLSILWFVITLLGYINIQNVITIRHQQLMIYSYALCFSGVTLRLWLPTLLLFITEFDSAYNIVAWLCWIPNLIVAHIINKKINKTKNSNHIFQLKKNK
ncbi:putative membrane protein DUF2306 [Gelidibacter algens]|uniref:Putative membrane protein DUF2306 n=2 Tax=Gelidibacter algens TaxID=49280 RepID=A0A327SAY7_9FLAO|nr:DUF2306 domain-containing protein [Gelidibacter algens]RAJ25094.1 putative membrane protein DUF2306 [Gelidibacter algens]